MQFDKSSTAPDKNDDEQFILKKKLEYEMKEAVALTLLGGSEGLVQMTNVICQGCQKFLPIVDVKGKNGGMIKEMKFNRCHWDCYYRINDPYLWVGKERFYRMWCDVCWNTKTIEKDVDDDTKKKSKPKPICKEYKKEGKLTGKVCMECFKNTCWNCGLFFGNRDIDSDVNEWENLIYNKFDDCYYCNDCYYCDV